MCFWKIMTHDSWALIQYNVNRFWSLFFILYSVIIFEFFCRSRMVSISVFSAAVVGPVRSEFSCRCRIVSINEFSAAEIGPSGSKRNVVFIFSTYPSDVGKRVVWKPMRLWWRSDRSSTSHKSQNNRHVTNLDRERNWVIPWCPWNYYFSCIRVVFGQKHTLMLQRKKYSFYLVKKYIKFESRWKNEYDAYISYIGYII